MAYRNRYKMKHLTVMDGVLSVVSAGTYQPVRYEVPERAEPAIELATDFAAVSGDFRRALRKYANRNPRLVHS